MAADETDEMENSQIYRFSLFLSRFYFFKFHKTQNFHIARFHIYIYWKAFTASVKKSEAEKKEEFFFFSLCIFCKNEMNGWRDASQLRASALGVAYYALCMCREMPLQNTKKIEGRSLQFEIMYKIESIMWI